MNYNQLHSDYCQHFCLGSGICKIKEQEGEKIQEKKIGEQQQRDILGRTWMPGEVRREVAENKNRVGERVWAREGEKRIERSEVGQGESLTYFADSHNTRTWLSQRTGNSGGEISFFHFSLRETFTALRDKPAHWKSFKSLIIPLIVNKYELFHPLFLECTHIVTWHQMFFKELLYFLILQKH